MKEKKGVYGINSLGTVAVILVVAAIIISMGGTILKNIQDTEDDNQSAAYNATREGLNAMVTLGDWLPTIAI